MRYHSLSRRRYWTTDCSYICVERFIRNETGEWLIEQEDFYNNVVQITMVRQHVFQNGVVDPAAGDYVRENVLEYTPVEFEGEYLRAELWIQRIGQTAAYRQEPRFSWHFFDATISRARTGRFPHQELMTRRARQDASSSNEDHETNIHSD